VHRLEQQAPPLLGIGVRRSYPIREHHGFGPRLLEGRAVPQASEQSEVVVAPAGTVVQVGGKQRGALWRLSVLGIDTTHWEPQLDVLRELEVGGHDTSARFTSTEFSETAFWRLEPGRD
jgi:hypothetical protein